MVVACLRADAVAHIAQTGDTGHVLQFAVAVGAACQAIQRVVGDVQLHHAFAQVLQLRCLGVHHHAVFSRCGARGRVAFAAVDFYQTQAARTEGFQAVGGAQLRHLYAGVNRCAHQRCALGHADLIAVDIQADGFSRGARRRAMVAFLFQIHQHGDSLRDSGFGFFQTEISGVMVES